jgi:poly(A) polymerase
MMQACDETIIQQIKQVSLPKYLTARIRDIWMMQSKLEKMHPKKVQFLLGHPRFRMGYDFLMSKAIILCLP